jgi:hypothetical protein
MADWRDDLWRLVNIRPGRTLDIRGLMLGTEAQRIAVPTSTTLQLRELMQVSSERQG